MANFIYLFIKSKYRSLNTCEVDETWLEVLVLIPCVMVIFDFANCFPCVNMPLDVTVCRACCWAIELAFCSLL